MNPDQTLRLVREGYAFLPNCRHAAGQDVVTTRLLGRRVVAACGPQWVEQFYDAALFERSSAVPEPVRRTLFGDGDVQALDRTAHTRRKQLFMAVLHGDGVDALVAAVLRAWEEMESTWPHLRRVVLFDEVARLLWRGVSEWTGLTAVAGTDPSDAADMVRMVDGFGTVDRRHWRARLARSRQERRVGATVERVRAGGAHAPDGSALHAVVSHRDEYGEPLSARVAAVELLNILRPTVAITWFVAFAAHAMQLWPRQRELLATGDRPQVTAFVHELRRFYPFAPFLGAIARQDLDWEGQRIRAGGLVLLDVFGQHHHPAAARPAALRGTPSGSPDPAVAHPRETRQRHGCAVARSLTVFGTGAHDRALVARTALPGRHQSWSAARGPHRDRRVGGGHGAGLTCAG